ncbi:MAG TPA: hypothetical protein VEC99_02735, partial [Clostridia bacterium]|nr:hypothetical protein [Clostridia bacterium]
MKRLLQCVAVLSLTSLLYPAWAVTPKPGEFAACQAWSDRVFGATSSGESRSYLKLLYEDAPEAVTRGRSWRGG